MIKINDQLSLTESYKQQLIDKIKQLNSNSPLTFQSTWNEIKSEIENLDIVFPKSEVISDNDIELFIGNTLKSATLNVPKITPYAFYNKTALQSLTLLNCKEIGEYSFYNCSNLKEVNALNAFKLNSYCFYSCTSLSTLNIDWNSIKTWSIGHTCLQNTGLTKIEMPELETVSSSTFLDSMSKLTEINLPKLTSISRSSNSALSNLNSLKILNLPKLSSCGGRTFSTLPALEEINLPSLINYKGGTSYQDDYILYNCSKLKKINLDNLKTIGRQGNTTTNSYEYCGLLYSCTSLEELNLPELEEIDTCSSGSIISTCTKLKNISFPKLNKCIKSWNAYNTKYLFSNCPGIEVLNFPELERFENWKLFSDNNYSTNNNLKELYLPKLKTWTATNTIAPFEKLSKCNIISIGDGSYSSTSTDLTALFRYNSNLKYLILNVNNVLTLPTDISSTSNSNPFLNCLIQTKGFVFVPDILLSTYREATNWSSIADRILPLSELNYIIWEEEYKSNYGIAQNSTETTIKIPFISYNKNFTTSIKESSNNVIKSKVENIYIENNVLIIKIKDTSDLNIGDSFNLDIALNYNNRECRIFNLTFNIISYNLEVELNVTGTSYGFSLNTTDGYYKSNNYGKQSSTAYCKLNYLGPVGSKLYLKCVNYNENCCDFGLVGKEDDSNLPVSGGTMIEKSFMNSTYTYESPYILDLGECDGNTHFRYIAYRKDHSVDSGYDCFAFIPYIE